MQQTGKPPSVGSAVRFQSSSSQKAGCNSYLWSQDRACTSFNPHPARRPDATSSRRSVPTARRCFNPHPARRPDATGPRHRDLRGEGQVSILIQPEGRMQRSTLTGEPGEVSTFQSSSSQKAGCNTFIAFACLLFPIVSILIQPEGRMQRATIAGQILTFTQFQSSSSQKAGCNSC